jgi:energy-converting hydrogenase Eha subunit C
MVAVCVVGAGLLVASGAIHLHLWNEYYRHIKTGHMNVLFLIQWIACFVAAAALLVMRNALAALGCTALLAGTFIGYLIARYHHGGLFGFYLGAHFSSSDATAALTIEIIGTALLAITTLAMLRGGERGLPAARPATQ